MTARRKILKRLTSGTMAMVIVSLTAHSVFAAIVYWLPITINTPVVALNIVEIQVVTETSAINSENQDKVILATEEVSEGKTEAENITRSPESTPVFDSEPLAPPVPDTVEVVTVELEIPGPTQEVIKEPIAEPVQEVEPEIIPEPEPVLEVVLEQENESEAVVENYEPDTVLIPRSKPVIKHALSTLDLVNAEKVKNSVEPTQVASLPVENGAIIQSPSESTTSLIANSQAPISMKTVDMSPPSFKGASLNNPKPFYPKRARRKGLEGHLIIRAMVNTQGAVEKIEIIKSSGHKILDAAAIKAIQKWQFKPGMQNGKKTTAPIDIPVSFSLSG